MSSHKRKTNAELIEELEALEARVIHTEAQLSALREQNALVGSTVEEAIRYQSDLLDSVGEAIVGVDVDGQITYWGPGAEQLYGFSAKEMLGKPITSINNRTDEGFQTILQYIREHGLWSGRSQRFTTDKTPIWINSTISLITDQSGTPTGYISVGRDITEQMNVEKAEQEQRKFTEALQSNILTIRDSLEMEGMLSRILENLDAIVPHDTASIMLLEGETAHLVKGRGYEEQGFQGKLTDLYFPITDLPVLSSMRETQLPVLVDDITTDPRWAEYREAESINWIRSYLGVPISQEGELLGFLNVDSTQKNYFSETHAAHAQTFANQIASATRNARLYEETIRRTLLSRNIAPSEPACNART